MVYEEQSVTIAQASLANAIVLELSDYLTPHSTASFAAASITGTSRYSPNPIFIYYTCVFKLLYYNEYLTPPPTLQLLRCAAGDRNHGQCGFRGRTARRGGHRGRLVSHHVSVKSGRCTHPHHSGSSDHQRGIYQLLQYQYHIPIIPTICLDSQ
jgi:hypothetical protein